MVDQRFREVLYDYANGYLAKGNEGLAVYRDITTPTVVADEFKAMVNRMPELTAYLPDVRRYLLDYPATTLPNSTDFLYWQEAEFGLKPTIRVTHLVIKEAPTETVIASKMLYASHYFWTALELRILVSDPKRGPGFWFVNINRSRTDGLDGLLGRLIRGRVRGGVQKGIMVSLRTAKEKMETPSP
jgi:hypothetical protein